jgi:hypothetical protein
MTEYLNDTLILGNGSLLGYTRTRNPAKTFLEKDNNESIDFFT